MKKDLDKKPSKGLPPTPEVTVSVVLGNHNYDNRFVSATTLSEFPSLRPHQKFCNKL